MSEQIKLEKQEIKEPESRFISKDRISEYTNNWEEAEEWIEMPFSPRKEAEKRTVEFSETLDQSSPFGMACHSIVERLRAYWPKPISKNDVLKYPHIKSIDSKTFDEAWEHVIEKFNCRKGLFEHKKSQK